MRGTGVASRGVAELYTDSLVWSMVHPRRSPLGIVGGCVMWHCALSVGSRVGASVAGCFMRERVGFSDQARKPVGGGVDAVHKGVGKRWPRACSTVPCRHA
jgi:hypothetical protein